MHVQLDAPALLGQVSLFCSLRRCVFYTLTPERPWLGPCAIQTSVSGLSMCVHVQLDG